MGKDEWRDDEGRESTEEISKEWYRGQEWEGCGGIRNEWTRTSTDVESKLDKVNSSREVIYRR